MRTKSWNIDQVTGMLRFDREFAVVDSFGVALRLNAHPKLTLIEPRIDVDKQLLYVRAPNCDELVIDISPGRSFTLERDITVYQEFYHSCVK